jgi:hypothetical protein
MDQFSRAQPEAAKRNETTFIPAWQIKVKLKTNSKERMVPGDVWIDAVTGDYLGRAE